MSWGGSTPPERSGTHDGERADPRRRTANSPQTNQHGGTEAKDVGLNPVLDGDRPESGSVVKGSIRHLEGNY